MYPRDPYGDPRDYVTEVREILAGTVPLSPTLAHCQALLRAVLRHEEPA